MAASYWNRPTYLELVHEPTYEESLRRLGELERLEDALTGVYWALSTNPEVYEVVKGFADIRLIKTDAYLVPHCGCSSCSPELHRADSRGCVNAMSDTPKQPDRFRDLLTRLVRVPKREIDKQEKKYQQERAEQKNQPAKKRA